MVHIAVPIKVKGLEQAVHEIQEAESKKPDLLELRLDYMPALDEKKLDILMECCDLPVIATIRHKSEAGPDKKAGYKGREEKRAELYMQAVKRGAAYVDIEALKYEGIIGYLLDKKGKANKRETKVIASYHNFEKTPENLVHIYKAFRHNLHAADVFKFATQANSEEDYKRIVELIEQANRDNVPAIGIGMGEPGEKTRLHPGNYITYACLEKGKGTAKGQYTVEEMRRLIG